MKREYPEQPVLAVAMCIRDGSKVLLVRRNKEPGKGRWSFPGGVVELGEDLIDALKREIKEELGIEVEVQGLLGIFQRIQRDEEGKVRYHYVIIDYFGRSLEDDISPSEEIMDFKWIEMSELPEYVQDPNVLNALSQIPNFAL